MILQVLAVLSLGLFGVPDRGIGDPLAFCRELVWNTYVRPLELADPALAISTDHFRFEDAPRRFTVTVFANEPYCCGKPGVKILEVAIVLDDMIFVGLSAKGEVLDRAVSSAVREKRREGGLAGFVHAAGWKAVTRSEVDGRDPTKENLAIDTGASPGSRLAIVDRRSGLLVFAGVPL